MDFSKNTIYVKNVSSVTSTCDLSHLRPKSHGTALLRREYVKFPATFGPANGNKHNNTAQKLYACYSLKVSRRKREKSGQALLTLAWQVTATCQ